MTTILKKYILKLESIIENNDYNSTDLYDLGNAWIQDGKKHKGLRYLRRACDLGSGMAAYELGLYYLSESDDNETGIHYMEKAAELGHPSAKLRLKSLKKKS